jgi:subtilisin family serine protease
VLNNSWGCPQFEGCDPLVFLPSVGALEAAGIFVVSGAGNDGPACSTINSPLAVYDEVFAVGAIDQFGELANFSSLGPVLVDGSQRTKPDLVAPGVEVLSTLPNSSYGAFSGTSMASPHVAGVVALLWSANPNLVGDIDTTWQLLTESAQPFSGNLPACQGAQNTPSTASGYGILDAFAAVQMALTR